MKKLIIVGMAIALNGCAMNAAFVSNERNFWATVSEHSGTGSQLSYCVANYDEKSGVASPLCYAAEKARFSERGAIDRINKELDDAKRASTQKPQEKKTW